MRRYSARLLCPLVVVFGLIASPAVADDDAFRMDLHFSQQNATGATNTDMAFWGNRAYVGNYGGFSIFDISNPRSPRLVNETVCYGAQNDLTVWDRDGDGRADLLFASVDRTLTSPQCSATPNTTAHDDPAGWEGIRIFDISDETNPVQIGSVYQDCGSHTHTLLPQTDRGRLLLLNSSYPLRPGPTCGPERGPQAGRDPLHGVIQVVQVPLADPAAASELTELPLTYPGDPDNRFVPAEHGLTAPGLVQGMRACHDMTVFLEAGLVAAACAEQLQLWRIGADGLPNTASPVWVYDQPNVDFWHSATFSWDAKVVNAIDESFGDGCPTVTRKNLGTATEREYETGNMFFLRTETGERLSEFRFPRREGGVLLDAEGKPVTYCSAHLGNVIPMPGRDLLVNAWYRGGVDVIDFTNPRSPHEIAWYTRDGADNWAAYWYEHGTPHPGSDISIFATSGIHVPAQGFGFEAYSAEIRGRRIGLDHLNPQTQERIISNAGQATPDDDGAGKPGKGNQGRPATPGKPGKGNQGRPATPGKPGKGNQGRPATPGKPVKPGKPRSKKAPAAAGRRLAP